MPSPEPFLSSFNPMRGVAKSNLPQKDCAHCGRPFTWRKKWERDWDQVKFCSDRCRAESKKKPLE